MSANKIMTKEQFKTSITNDPLNERGGRNRRNTPCKSYNCGGFALSVYDWVCPYDQKRNTDEPWNEKRRIEFIEDSLDEGFLLADIIDDVVDKDAHYLLQHYPFLKQVDISECHRDDLIIAYRIFITTDGNLIDDTDFHFRVYYHGYWFEKMGGTEITLCTGKIDDPWYVDENTIYNSKIAYFISKREFI